MLQLFNKSNKRFEWLKEKLNLEDYELKETYPYKRITRYEKYIKEVRILTREKRLEKLNTIKSNFEKQKELFFNERDKILLEIQKEITDLGFNEIKFPVKDLNI